MAYTPPAGNAINFVFVNYGYSPPAGNAIHFVFGGSIPPPPPGSTALPNAITRARQDIEEWFPTPQREYAFISTTPAVVLTPYERPEMPDFTEDWFPIIRSPKFQIPVTVVVSDDDIVVQFIW